MTPAVSSTHSHAGLMYSSVREHEAFFDQPAQEELYQSTPQAEAECHAYNNRGDMMAMSAIKRAATRAYKRYPAVANSLFASQLARLRQAKQGQTQQTAQQYESGRACAAPQGSEAQAPSSVPGRVWEGHTGRAADAVATAGGRAALRAAAALSMCGATGRAAAEQPDAPAAAALSQHPAGLAAEEPGAPAAAALSQHPAGQAAAGEAPLTAEDGTSQGAMHELGRGLRRRVRTKRLHRQSPVTRNNPNTVRLETGKL